MPLGCYHPVFSSAELSDNLVEKEVEKQIWGDLPEPALSGGPLLADLAMAVISLLGLLGFSVLDRCTREKKTSCPRDRVIEYALDAYNAE